MRSTPGFSFGHHLFQLLTSTPRPDQLPDGYRFRRAQNTLGTKWQETYDGRQTPSGPGSAGERCLVECDFITFNP